MHYCRSLLLNKLIPTAFLLASVFSFAVVPAARAQLSFTISPVDGHVDQYTVTIDGGAFTTPSTNQTFGSITTDSAFFANTAGSYESIVGGSINTYSSGAPPEPSVVNLLISGATLGFEFGDAGVMGAFTGYGLTGSATSTFSVATGIGATAFTYADLTPGTYTITGGSGAFANNLNYGGTLTIEAAAVPEPATYAGVLALVALGFAGWRRRKLSGARS